jgi:serine/threonine-protein kinase/endoribonuclease IRE1
MAPLSYLSTLFLSTVSTCLAEVAHLGAGSSVARWANHRPNIQNIQFLPPAGSSHTSHENDDLDLLDIVLVASVDGNFHALNRSTGHALWSMTDGATEPLVRTAHIVEDDAEQYIIEPQSGDIYVVSSPNAPLQRLPFSMSQLVDMSPFSFTGDEDKVFIGKKNTSLLVLELETGKIKSKISSEACLWDPPEEVDPFELDLDALEGGEESGKSTPREIYIGRTGVCNRL